MNTLSVPGTHNAPKIYFSPSENRFEIEGKSAPEDVRELYYPVIEWITSFVKETKAKNSYTRSNPLVLKLNLEYFNSSSAKFIYDIILGLKELKKYGVPALVEWHYEQDDIDLREAGEDLAALSQVEFKYCPWERDKK